MDRHYQPATPTSMVWAELFFKSFTDFHPCKNSLRIRVEDNENKFWALTNALEPWALIEDQEVIFLIDGFFSLNTYFLYHAQSLGILCIKMKAFESMIFGW